MDPMEQLFACVAVHGATNAERIRQCILASGLRFDDYRLRSTMATLDALADPSSI